MTTFIFQIHIKQWDKSQREPHHVAARAAIPNCYTIEAKPEYCILNKPCIIDRHADGLSATKHIQRPLKTAMNANGSVSLDRFNIHEHQGKMLLMYTDEKKDVITIGDLYDGWIQAIYQCRFPVEVKGQIYWVYEEFTLNAACIQTFNADYFLTNPAQFIFNTPCKL